MSPLEGEKEKVKEENGLKISTANELLTRLPILFSQIKSENISYELKMKWDTYYIFCIHTIKSPKHFATI